MTSFSKIHHNTLLLFQAIARDIRGGQLNLRAMGLVYTSLLSLVPLLALSFSVLKAFGVHNQIEPLLLGLLEPLGEKGIEISQKILEFVNNMQVGILGAVGMIMLIYTVISLMQKVEEAFNFTWRVQSSRSLAERFSHYLSVLIIGPVLMFSALGLWASIVNTTFIQDIVHVQPLGHVLATLAKLTPKLLIVGAFTFVYIFTPNTRVKLWAAFIGAAVAGSLWQINSWAFAAFVVNSTSHTAIYSVFATLIIFMIWIYLGWLILLVGSSIAFYVQNLEYARFMKENVSLSAYAREKISLGIMKHITQRHYQQKNTLTVTDLKTGLALPQIVIQQVVDILIDHHVLTYDDQTPPHILPAIPLDEFNISSLRQKVAQGSQTEMEFNKKLDELKTCIDLQSPDALNASLKQTFHPNK